MKEIKVLKANKEHKEFNLFKKKDTALQENSEPKVTVASDTIEKISKILTCAAIFIFLFNE